MPGLFLCNNEPPNSIKGREFLRSWGILIVLRRTVCTIIY
jgi:hypothetical protein